MTDPSPTRPSLEPVEIRVADHIVLRGDRVGEDGPVALLMHGGGQTRWAWKNTALRLAEIGMTVYSMDLRGHGESDWAPGAEYSFLDYADDVDAMIDHLGEGISLVGASLGGISSMVAEARRPRSGSLVLVDITHSMQPEGVERIFEFMTGAPDGFADLEEAADAVAAYMPHRPRPKDLDGLRKNLRQGEDGRWRWHWDPGFMTHRVNRPDDPRTLLPLEEYAVRLELPTLLVRGRMSDLISQEDADEFCRIVPHAEFADVTGAGHMVAGDRNDVFADAVIDFLRRHVLRG